MFTLARKLSSIRSERYTTIIAELVAARKAAGITQAELGRRLGQRQTFVSKFELGERRLDVAEFVEVCDAIGTDWRSVIDRAYG